MGRRLRGAGRRLGEFKVGGGLEQGGIPPDPEVSGLTYVTSIAACRALMG